MKALGITPLLPTGSSAVTIHSSMRQYQTNHDFLPTFVPKRTPSWHFYQLDAFSVTQATVTKH